MKLRANSFRCSRSDDGSAVVVVLVLLLAIMAFLEANTGTLRSMKRELQLIEQRQLIKYGESALTNHFGSNKLPHGR
jgi:hypothetical protein